MDQPQKNQLRLVTSSGNAFEALTTMTREEVDKSILDGRQEGDFATFDCLNERDEPVVLEVMSTSIEGVMMQRHNKVRT
jgi:hypothetical protein